MRHSRVDDAAQACEACASHLGEQLYRRQFVDFCSHASRATRRWQRRLVFSHDRATGTITRWHQMREKSWPRRWQITRGSSSPVPDSGRFGRVSPARALICENASLYRRMCVRAKPPVRSSKVDWHSCQVPCARQSCCDRCQHPLLAIGMRGHAKYGVISASKSMYLTRTRAGGGGRKLLRRFVRTD
jgi:hypothetical protein